MLSVSETLLKIELYQNLDFVIFQQLKEKKKKHWKKIPKPCAALWVAGDWIRRRPQAVVACLN